MPVPTLTLAEVAGRDVLTVEETAAILGLSRGGTYAGCRSGELPAVKVGARYLIPVRRLSALLGLDLDEPGPSETPSDAPATPAASLSIVGDVS
jgi:excisionase family DNA binding protein